VLPRLGLTCSFAIGWMAFLLLPSTFPVLSLSVFSNASFLLTSYKGVSFLWRDLLWPWGLFPSSRKPSFFLSLCFPNLFPSLVYLSDNQWLVFQVTPLPLLRQFPFRMLSLLIWLYVPPSPLLFWSPKLFPTFLEKGPFQGPLGKFWTDNFWPNGPLLTLRTNPLLN